MNYYLPVSPCGLRLPAWYTLIVRQGVLQSGAGRKETQPRCPPSARQGGLHSGAGRRETQPQCPPSARQGGPQSGLRFVFKELHYYLIKLQSNLTGRNLDFTHDL